MIKPPIYALTLSQLENTNLALYETLKCDNVPPVNVGGSIFIPRLPDPGAKLYVGPPIVTPDGEITATDVPILDAIVVIAEPFSLIKDICAWCDLVEHVPVAVIAQVLISKNNVPLNVSVNTEEWLIVINVNEPVIARVK